MGNSTFGSEPPTADPWVEVITAAVENNVRELNRFSGLPLMAVAKNNANGIGIRQIGAILDRMDEVEGLAVVRVAEALALRDCGVSKPILMMAHVVGADAAALVRAGVRLTPFHADSPQRLSDLARRLDRPVPVHVCIDTGINRIGMPYDRAVAWIKDLVETEAVEIEGAYTMFAGAIRDGSSFDIEQLRRFHEVVAECRELGIDLGLLHGAPSDQVVSLPQARSLDLIRPGGAIYGLHAYLADSSGTPVMDLKPVFRLRAAVARVELLARGEGVSFGHRYRAEHPTWIATVPTGHTDGYPAEAAGNCVALVGDRLFPVIGRVSSNHTTLEVGPHRQVDVGDVATLVGPDRAEIKPIEVARRSGLERDYWIMTRLNPLLPRIVVDH